MAAVVVVEIETCIRNLSWASFQAGQKSIQRITVDLQNRRIASEYRTGHTRILGITLGSVRDGFTITGQHFTKDGTAYFHVKGQTASGVQIMPNIDYSFTFEVSRDTVRFWGAHDGYPSYNVAINGRSAYDHVQGHIGQLFGSSDIQVHPRSVKVN